MAQNMFVRKAKPVLTRLTAIVAVAVALVSATVAQAQSQRSSRPVARRAAPRTSVPQHREIGRNENSSKVTQASHLQVMEGDSYVVSDPGPISGPISGTCSSCDGGGCGSCSTDLGLCGSCSVPQRFCICFPSHGWVHTEYLNWYQAGMRVPALVTSNNGIPARTAAGVLPGATTLYGGSNDFHDDYLDGFRIRFGWWLRCLPGWGVEGEYVGLGEDVQSFFQQSTGNPVLARPFFNVLTGLNDAELIAYPGVVTGDIGVTS
ncbi:MAG TPA: hypothetical protein DDW52_21075, partial [Planctomycetaceae bacterium]|nr:hypothetical protein [Planctomycetaceae bacterium]